jgi:hypothetical protein
MASDEKAKLRTELAQLKVGDSKLLRMMSLLLSSFCLLYFVNFVSYTSLLYLTFQTQQVELAEYADFWGNSGVDIKYGGISCALSHGGEVLSWDKFIWYQGPSDSFDTPLDTSTLTLFATSRRCNPKQLGIDCTGFAAFGHVFLLEVPFTAVVAPFCLFLPMLWCGCRPRTVGVFSDVSVARSRSCPQEYRGYDVQVYS